MNLDLAHKALKKYFGYDEFRPLQADIIKNVYDGKDTVVLMPTGGGKSVCFQIPAVTMEGTALVVSPLIALMKDQVDGMNAIGVKAAFMNSSMNSSDQYGVEGMFVKGQLDLLYVSPEKLMTADFQSVMASAKISLIAIDEAHCISSWGHNFRPEYRQLHILKTKFPNVPVIALTATADKVTRNDIGNQLGLVNPKLFLASFDRPNLKLEVRPGRKKWEQIVNFLKNHADQSGIIYCLSRKNCETLAAKLQKAGHSANFYHAGMSAQQRDKIQTDFINDRIDIICATIAFGMGIDKSNIRWVIHYNLPKNIEGFYQEIGRAGRDSVEADTMLFFSYADVIFMKKIINDDGDNGKELMLNKLERLVQYASSPVCRRKTLLSYFGEYLSENCGNCDICESPPETIDGTVIAQMALSAVHRMKSQANTNLLINVLRGSQGREVYESGFSSIKTYGMGKEHSYHDWKAYIEQIIQQGFLEIALDDHYRLRPTEASKAVLFEGKKVKLVKLASIKEREQKAEAGINEKPKTPTFFEYDKELFKRLKALRLQLSREHGVPPYIVFNDKTLQELSAVKPTEREQLLGINGVGEKKADQFGFDFMDAIKKYGKEQGIAEEDMYKPLRSKPIIAQKSTVAVKKKTPKIPTTQITHDMYKAGLSLEEIAQERTLHQGTVLGHLVKLYKEGKDINLRKFVDQTVMKQVLAEAKKLEGTEEGIKMKPIFEALGEEISYDQIRLSLNILSSEGEI